MPGNLERKRSSEMLDRESLLEEATDLLLACLASIPPKNIQPLKYWDWALKAVKVGADRGADFGRMVSEMHNQLPINRAFTKASSRAICSKRSSIEQAGRFDDFRAICRQYAPYIIAMAQVRKEEAKPDYWADSQEELTQLEEEDESNA